LVGKAARARRCWRCRRAASHANDNRYLRLLVSRRFIRWAANWLFARRSGPKLKPWMQPIFDNPSCCSVRRPTRPRNHTPSTNCATTHHRDGALTYIRGRSLPNVYLLIDEAQNLTPHEIQTTVTRVGENTKIVLTGDPYQIDNPYLDAFPTG
jgi:PhoH-like ATPase